MCRVLHQRVPWMLQWTSFLVEVKSTASTGETASCGESLTTFQQTVSTFLRLQLQQNGGERRQVIRCFARKKVGIVDEQKRQIAFTTPCFQLRLVCAAENQQLGAVFLLAGEERF